jgi:protein-tyrosine-phosphatase
MFSIVFVCTGNTCRSPMAADLGRRYLVPLGPEVEVSSAGLWATDGQPAAPHAQSIVHEMGGDLGGHRSRPVTPELMASSALVLTMTRRHKEELLHLQPGLGEKVFTLAEFSGVARGQDVEDPIGGPRALYERAYFQLEEYVRAAVPRVKERVLAERARRAQSAPNASDGSLQKGS